jgi:putative lumazine-binding protein
MKKLLILLLLSATPIAVNAQSSSEEAAVKKACMNYLEGFYEGDTTKLKAALVPKLYKIGYWKSNGAEKHKFSSQMTYTAAVDYALDVKTKKQFAPASAPKEVKIFEVAEHIAAAKVTAWWGIDYLLLSKEHGSWMIEEVIWEGPLKKN